jgi:orotidine-5'-phosphate decarboxylase
MTTTRSQAAAATSAFEQARERLIVALDAPDVHHAMEVVSRLAGTCRWVKVGLELFISAGPRVVTALVEQGYNVFLDLKVHDIPNTAAGAVKSAAALGAKMLTVHAGGGPAMLTAAREALAGMNDAPQLLAVTVLTSMDAEQLKAVGVERNTAAQVAELAAMGKACGINGFVCSPQEVAALRKLTGPEGVLVIPGIRPAGAAMGDQKRVATPAEAIRQGASYLVVGRPITQAAHPAEAAEAVLKEMADAL